MLSNEDIKKELGENILIYPFCLDNIRGASINLTASRCAWLLSSGKSAVTEKPDGSAKITIPNGDTVLVETEEFLWVSKKIAGTYHSKVSLVSKGLSHIGTTLDPEWKGNSLIALTNYSQKPIEIECGKSFVSVCFEYLNSESTYADDLNDAGRMQILSDIGVKLSSKEKTFFNETWKSNIDSVKSKMKESDEYKKLIEMKKKSKRSVSLKKWFLSYWLAIVYFIIVIVLLLLQLLVKRFNDWCIGGMEPWAFMLMIGMSGFAVKLFAKK